LESDAGSPRVSSILLGETPVYQGHPPMGVLFSQLLESSQPFQCAQVQLFVANDMYLYVADVRSTKNPGHNSLAAHEFGRSDMLTPASDHTSLRELGQYERVSQAVALTG